MKRKSLKIALLGALCLLPLMPATADTRLEDIATVQGVRGNQLVGYGLVVGLAGTGDSQQVSFTIQSVTSMLQKFGVTVPQSGVTLKNVAAVMVTADLPAFAKEGNDIDVTVSSIGDSSSLQGGTLLQTPLQAANGLVYAVAQGSVSVGGFSSGGQSGSAVTKNHVTAGRVPGGGIVEQEVPMTLQHGSDISVTLDDPDFLTAQRVATAINANLPPGAVGAHATDAATIDIATSPGADPIPLIASLDGLTVAPDTPAKIVINERTGTVVLGGDVTVSACAIAHGNLTVQVSETPTVVQPNALSKGTTVVVPNSQVNVQEGAQHLIDVPDSPTIGKVVKALNALGVTPRDLIAILQAMKDAGALHADLEVQ
jgi:flagellar P-ring protein precursor FlgI